MKITLFRASFWRAKAGTVKCKNCIRNLEKALDKTGKVGYTNQAVSDKRKQISGCSAVLVARLNGVQEAVSSILATRTRKSNDFTLEIVGFFLFTGQLHLALTTILTTMRAVLSGLISVVPSNFQAENASLNN